MTFLCSYTAKKNWTVQYTYTLLLRDGTKNEISPSCECVYRTDFKEANASCTVHIQAAITDLKSRIRWGGGQFNPLPL